MEIKRYQTNDLPAMIAIWNEVVRSSCAFPQTEELTLEEGTEFFSSQSQCRVAFDEGSLVGLYILHPNNVGRCAHIANASYAVKAGMRGKGIGKQLVLDCIEQAANLGFRILQFNAVLTINVSAIHLYEKLGFVTLGVIKGGYQYKDGTYGDIQAMVKYLTPQSP